MHACQPARMRLYSALGTILDRARSTMRNHRWCWLLARPVTRRATAEAVSPGLIVSQTKDCTAPADEVVASASVTGTILTNRRVTLSNIRERAERRGKLCTSG